MMEWNNFQIAPFILDVTPPEGFPISYGINTKADSPIYIRGAVFDDGTVRAVFACADYIYIWGKAYHQWRRLLAKAAGTIQSHVFLHSVHQHDSLRVAVELNEICKRYLKKECFPLWYYKETTERLKQCVEQAVETRRGSWQKVSGIAAAERRVWGLASNRRLLDEKGKVWAMRFSMCSDSKMQKEPVGNIDPLLRSIGFTGKNGKLITVLHFYASHPMTAYGRNMVSADVPGVALNYLKENADGDSLHIYFNGCGGNITFGKYSLKEKEKSLVILGKRLGEGLVENTKKLEQKPLGPISFKHARFDFPIDPSITETEMLKRIKLSEDLIQIAQPGMRHVIIRNWDKWKQTHISRMSIGKEVHILSLPAETVVEYQLYAQSLVPEQFLACAAYGNGTYHYIPTKAMYDEGGYEVERGTIATPEIEERMKQAIFKVLKDLR